MKITLNIDAGNVKYGYEIDGWQGRPDRLRSLMLVAERTLKKRIVEYHLERMGLHRWQDRKVKML